MSDIQAKMRELIATHCCNLREEASQVRDALSRLSDPNADFRDAVADGLSRVHKIKGSSGTIGFSDVSALAQSLEDQLRRLYDAGAEPGARSKAHVLALGDELSARVAIIRPEQSTLYDLT